MVAKVVTASVALRMRGPSMTYASKTKVPVDQTRNEIERTLKRYGADRFAYFSESDRAIIVFEANERRIRFDLPLPLETRGGRDEQLARQRWRALLLCIKAKLESVESGIETFEDAFLAHVVMPDGQTVSDHVRPRIASVYSSGEVLQLLPPPSVERGSNDKG
ncbi:MAG: hypothetical protein QOD40_3266 [Alphaproteobacteria bacterium]|nr:hypothetical protein [Alphaproteobacteria bacterium]